MAWSDDKYIRTLLDGREKWTIAVSLGAIAGLVKVLTDHQQTNTSVLLFPIYVGMAGSLFTFVINCYYKQAAAIADVKDEAYLEARKNGIGEFEARGIATDALKAYLACKTSEADKEDEADNKPTKKNVFLHGGDIGFLGIMLYATPLVVGCFASFMLMGMTYSTSTSSVPVVSEQHHSHVYHVHKHYMDDRSAELLGQRDTAVMPSDTAITDSGKGTAHDNEVVSVEEPAPDTGEQTDTDP